MSQRRIALLFHVSRTTVARKLRYWGNQSRQRQRNFLAALPQPVTKLQFDELQTAEHSKGEKAAITGQGELKKKQRDPLFSINHTLAMLRANINRLVRRTWCTTKIYMDVHNTLVHNLKS